MAFDFFYRYIHCNTLLYWKAQVGLASTINYKVSRSFTLYIHMPKNAKCVINTFNYLLQKTE